MRSLAANGRALLAGVFVLLSGCALLSASDGIDRTVDAPPDRVFRATVTVLRDRGFSLEEVNRAKGRIVTARRPVQVVGTDPNRSPRLVEKARITLEPDGSQTDVRLFLQFVDQVSGPPRGVPDDGDDERADDVAHAALDRSYDAEVMYDDYLDAIEDRVRDLRGDGQS